MLFYLPFEKIMEKSYVINEHPSTILLTPLKSPSIKYPKLQFFIHYTNNFNVMHWNEIFKENEMIKVGQV